MHFFVHTILLHLESLHLFKTKDYLVCFNFDVHINSIISKDINLYKFWCKLKENNEWLITTKEMGCVLCHRGQWVLCYWFRDQCTGE